MALPAAAVTTTIRILRYPPDANRDPYDPKPALVEVAKGVRAHISVSRGTAVTAGGQQVVLNYRLSCDPCDMQHTDRVEDEKTGQVYDVQWVVPRQGHGLNHVRADLKQVEGIATEVSGAMQ